MSEVSGSGSNSTQNTAMRVVLVLGVIVGIGIWGFLSIKPPQPAPVDESVSAYGCVEDEPLPNSEFNYLVECTDEVGIDFQHTVGPLGTYYVPESVGSGAAWQDFNGDGFLDLLLINGGHSAGVAEDFPEGTNVGHVILRGNADHTFSAAAILDNRGFGMGTAVGDIDNDGDADIYVTCVKQDRLYLNEGNFQFRDVTDECGITENEWGTGAAYFDYDRDGLLDLVVANYTHDDEYDHQVACTFIRGDKASYCGPHKFQTTVDRLYRNTGQRSNSGVPLFEDVTSVAGLEAATTYGFTVVACDLTGDEWPDILIANDGQPNRFWVNQQNGTFKEEAVARGVAVNAGGVAEAGMGIAIGDVNHDLAIDLVFTHLATETTTVYVNDGDGYFHDGTDAANVGQATMRHTGWGAALIDLNHDGLLDLPMVHGLVIPCHSWFAPHGEDTFEIRNDSIPNQEKYWRDYADRNLLLMGSQAASFQDATIPSGGDFTRAIGSARGLLYGDPDEDGDLDLLVTNSGSRARFYRNDFPAAGHWLKLRLWDENTQRNALGAKVVIHCGETKRTSMLVPCTSFLTNHDPRIHFGLGTCNHVDSIQVHWPDGSLDDCVEQFDGGPADQELTLIRGQGNKKKESL
ncbi:MAG: CRTAC1 family protein [Planctomycetaceae bacterium]|nr:CRTAC1 family protein [Planctomycetaceae bacterium]